MTAQFQFFRAYPTKKPILLKKAGRTWGNFHIFGRFGIFPSLASGHIPQPMMARPATNYPANSAARLISLSLPTDIITQAEHPCISYHFIFAIQRRASVKADKLGAENTRYIDSGSSE